VQIIVVGGEVKFLITEVHNNVDNEEIIQPLLRLPNWGPGQELRSEYKQQCSHSKPSKLTESQKAINAFCRARSVKSGDER